MFAENKNERRKPDRRMPKEVYEIRVQGRLDEEWAVWFSGLTVTPVGDDETLLSGELPDQSALHGVLAQVRDLNLTLLSVQRIENPVQQSKYLSKKEKPR